MSFSRQNPSQCILGEAITFPGFEKKEKKEKKAEFVAKKKCDCRGAFALLQNTIPINTTTAGSLVVPLFPAAINPGFRFDSAGRAIAQECGTYVVAAIAETISSVTFSGPVFLDIVKIGCNGHEIISSAQLPVAVTIGTKALVPKAEVCLTPGERIQLELRGPGIDLEAVTTFSLFIQKINCCCELKDGCDRCDCPCKDHNGKSRF